MTVPSTRCQQLDLLAPAADQVDRRRLMPPAQAEVVGLLKLLLIECVSPAAPPSGGAANE